MEDKRDAAMKRVVVIGAGVGGLTTAAVLARAGLEVTVLWQLTGREETYEALRGNENCVCCGFGCK
jgi:2-polyprenyl-6-methoxyphenol hydroxylase-like FAD-dependent oxidoreductase